MTTLSAAAPELPVQNLEKALAYYQKALGFDVAWYREAEGIAGVARGDCAIFLRQLEGAHEAVTLWIHCEDVDRLSREAEVEGARIAEPPGDKPWGLRQAMILDEEGHRLIFHQG